MDIIEIGRQQMAPINLRFICPDCQSEQSHCIRPGTMFGRDDTFKPIYETRMVVCDRCKMLYSLDIYPNGRGVLCRKATLVTAEPWITKEIEWLLQEQPFFVELKDPLTGQWNFQSNGGW